MTLGRDHNREAAHQPADAVDDGPCGGFERASNIVTAVGPR
jgi:hypothetical protein